LIIDINNIFVKSYDECAANATLLVPAAIRFASFPASKLGMYFERLCLWSTPRRQSLPG
jgi:hypothetical protein